jgi:hypothetical protein
MSDAAMVRNAYSTLVRIAAELVRGDDLPPDYAEDYGGRKTLSVNVVARMMVKAHDRNKERAQALRIAADTLRAAAGGSSEE